MKGLPGPSDYARKENADDRRNRGVKHSRQIARNRIVGRLSELSNPLSALRPERCQSTRSAYMHLSAASANS